MVANNTGWKLTRTGVDLWGNGDDSAESVALFEHDDGRKIELLTTFTVACDVLVNGERPVWSFESFISESDDAFNRAVEESGDDDVVTREWYAYPDRTQFSVVDYGPDSQVISGNGEPEESGAVLHLPYRGAYDSDTGGLDDAVGSVIGSYAVRDGYMTLYTTPLDDIYCDLIWRGEMVA